MSPGPQTPGKVKIEFTPDNVEISVDGYRLEQHVSGVRFELDTERRPVVYLELLPSSVDITADKVKLDGEFRDFLIAHGWKAPS